jgi:hypothetical protein
MVVFTVCLLQGKSIFGLISKVPDTFSQKSRAKKTPEKAPVHVKKAKKAKKHIEEEIEEVEELEDDYDE